MKLNDRQIKNAKPSSKIQKLSDGSGLSLVIKPTGGKYWQLNYRFNGKQKTLSIGVYPTVSLAEARAAREAAKKQLANGIDPSQAKQQAKAEQIAALANTFKNITYRWHGDNTHRWKPNHATRILNHLEKDVFPFIGEKQLNDITAGDVKAIIERVASRKAVATAEKIRQWIGAIYKYAAMLEITDRNPAMPLQGFLIKAETRHMPALPKERVIELYSRLLIADIEQKNKIALMLTMLTFPRSTELRGGEWGEIDFKANIWTIPAERMKLPRSHAIPLSDWAIELLQELHQLTGDTPYLFPSRTRTIGYISDATLTRILERLGYKGIATPHGFRSLASSVLNEQGFNADAIERQLAHIPKDKIRAAYNRADYWQQRIEMMQWYSDWLRQQYNTAIELIKAT